MIYSRDNYYRSISTIQTQWPERLEPFFWGALLVKEALLFFGCGANFLLCFGCGDDDEVPGL
ncbi:MAG: hypothetical protein ACI8PG_004067 [Planctomycetota bacterium]|jgi:hypothetical protein